MSGDQLNLDAIEAQARFSALTGNGTSPARSTLALVAEVRRLRAEAENMTKWLTAQNAVIRGRAIDEIADTLDPR